MWSGIYDGSGVAKNLASMIVKGKPIIDRKTMASLRADRDFYASKKEMLK